MWWRRLLLGVVGLFLLIQLKPVVRTNPPLEQEMPAPTEVRAILARACYDCHSNRTEWPWYAWVAPVSWRVTEHVADGRKHLNFSTWNRYDDKKKRHRVSDILEEVATGAMPLSDYLRMHPDAALEPLEIATLRDWVVDYRPEDEEPWANDVISGADTGSTGGP